MDFCFFIWLYNKKKKRIEKITILIREIKKCKFISYLFLLGACIGVKPLPQNNDNLKTWPYVPKRIT